MLERGNHGVAHLRCSHAGRARAMDVRCAQALIEYARNGLLDSIGGLRLLQAEAQHHGGTEDGGKGVGNALARNVRGATVAGFVQALVALVQAGLGQHADAAGEHGRGVRQDVSEHVARDDHVETFGRAYQLHRRVVDVHVLQRDVRVMLCHLGQNFLPQLKGLQQVRLSCQ